jgi:hypothetical protein
MTNIHDADLLSYLADVLVLFVQYGNRTGTCQMFNQNKNLPLEKQLIAIRDQGFLSDTFYKDYDRNYLKNVSNNWV